MNQKSLKILGIAISLIIAIFLFLPTKTNKSLVGGEKMSTNKTLETYKSEFISKQSDSLRIFIGQIEADMIQAKDSQAKINAYTNCIALYTKMNSPELAALSVFQKAEIIKNTNSWELAGDNFVSLMADPKLDTLLLSDIANYATKSYKNSHELDTNNTEATIKLAQCYMELANQPMQGVPMLLSVVRKDEKNIKAQLLLAKFGMVSGQYEKVLSRLEKVLSLQSQNLDALLMRAEVYAQTGKNDLAAKDLESAKSNPKVDKNFKQQLDLAIQNLKKQ